MPQNNDPEDAEFTDYPEDLGSINVEEVISSECRADSSGRGGQRAEFVEATQAGRADQGASGDSTSTNGARSGATAPQRARKSGLRALAALVLVLVILIGGAYLMLGGSHTSKVAAANPQLAEIQREAQQISVTPVHREHSPAPVRTPAAVGTRAPAALHVGSQERRPASERRASPTSARGTIDRTAPSVATAAEPVSKPASTVSAMPVAVTQPASPNSPVQTGSVASVTQTSQTPHVKPVVNGAVAPKVMHGVPTDVTAQPPAAAATSQAALKDLVQQTAALHKELAKTQAALAIAKSKVAGAKSEVAAVKSQAAAAKKKRKAAKPKIVYRDRTVYRATHYTVKALLKNGVVLTGPHHKTLILSVGGTTP